MTTLLDANGNPINRAVLSEPQTSRVAHLARPWINGQAAGITPARAARILREADNGDLLAQHELFDDMLDRDTHLAGEFAKRTGAPCGLGWSVEPPLGASKKERMAASWAEEVLRDVVSDFEDLLAAMMAAIGHGFAPIELDWRLNGAERIPVFYSRPQTWFQLSADRRDLRLRDGSSSGAALWPMGWIIHRPGMVKTGYQGRAGLLRSLVWPWIYHAYALIDFAEYLETYGLPFIIGKYFSGASDDEKATLLRAVTMLGHDARAIMPQEMALEIQKITGGGGSTPHLDMMRWAEMAMSKLILGATLTTQADGKTSTNALGDVHNEVRRDIRRTDAIQLAGTLTRDLVYPMIVVNRGGIDDLSRCPRLRFDTGEAEDMSALAQALPALAKGGARIPIEWVHEKLRIPLASDGEPIFGETVNPVPGEDPATDQPAAQGQAAARQQIATTEDPTPVTALTGRLSDESVPAMAQVLDHIRKIVNEAASLEALRDSLLQSYGTLPGEELAAVMRTGFAVAELAGMADVSGDR